MDEVFDLDPEQAHASLDRIVDIEADLLPPGHGEAWPGSPADAVSLARSCGQSLLLRADPFSLAKSSE